MVFFLFGSNLKHFSRRDKTLYYACQVLMLMSSLAMLVALIAIIIISLTVHSPYIGAAAREFTNSLRIGAFLAVGLCTLGLAVSTLGTRWIAGKNRIGMVIVADDDSEEITLEESIEINRMVDQAKEAVKAARAAKNPSGVTKTKGPEAATVVYYEVYIDGKKTAQKVDK